MNVLLALLLDWFLQEPPARLHPVVWMGGYLNLVGRPLTRLNPRWALLMGSAFWLLGGGLIAGIYTALEALLSRLGVVLIFCSRPCCLSPFLPSGCCWAKWLQ